MNKAINKDYRKKDNLKWFNDNYFISIYDNNDNYITSFEDIESICTAFNIKIANILKYIRYNINLEYNNKKCKMFVYKKESIEKSIRRR